MTDEAASRRVAERLAALREADGRLARALKATTAGVSSIPETAIDMESAKAMAAAIAALRQPLAAEMGALASADEVSTLQDLDRGGDGPAPSSAKASDAVQGAYGAVGEASGAAASLFTTGRLMFEGAVCDLAIDRMKTYAQATKALNTLLPQVIGWELREEGLACHCVCPMPRTSGTTGTVQGARIDSTPATNANRTSTSVTATVARADDEPMTRVVVARSSSARHGSSTGWRRQPGLGLPTVEESSCLPPSDLPPAVCTPLAPPSPSCSASR
jgi:hypothetical protein